MPSIAYLSHALGSDLGPMAMPSRLDNMANAVDWYAFLHDVTSWVVVMPWYPSVVALRELMRPRSLRDQLTVLARSDLLVLCGGYISPHMENEVAQAGINSIAVVDLVDLGPRPPRQDIDRARVVIREREQEALRAVSGLE